jgi:hypothetical protein
LNIIAVRRGLANTEGFQAQGPDLSLHLIARPD